MSKALCKCVTCRAVFERAMATVERMIADEECVISILSLGHAFDMIGAGLIQIGGRSGDEAMLISNIVGESLAEAAVKEGLTKEIGERLADMVNRAEKRAREERNLPKGD